MAYTSLDHYLKHWEGCLYNYRVLWANITPSSCTCCSGVEAKSKWTLTVRISNVEISFFKVRRFLYLPHALNLKKLYFAYRMNLNYRMILRNNTFLSFCATAPTRGPGPPHSPGFLMIHNDALQSVGLLWTSDQLVAENSTWQYTTFTTHRLPCSRWDSNPQSQLANGRRPTP